MSATATPQRLEDFTANCNAWLEIDLEALAHNLATLRNAIKPGVEIMAVVKANAYGHGASGIAQELERLGVDRLAVGWVSEGLALRGAGISVPIVVLGHAFPADAAAAVTENLTLTCDTRELADAVSREAASAPTRSRIHIKVDTGLHRFGLDVEAAVTLAEYARALPGVEVEGLSTHMANADEADDSFSEEQGRSFAAVAARLPWIPVRHLANSATTIRRPALRYEGVRVGLSLYGLMPDNTPDMGLKPVMSVRGRLARIAAVGEGDGVGYGLAWRAEGDRRVGLVPIGYADGWRRSLTGGCGVILDGRLVPSVGRIAMDQFHVDVTDVPDAKVGDVVTLLGTSGNLTIGAGEIAAAAGTISWEILAGMQARLPRVFHRGLDVATGIPS